MNSFKFLSNFAMREGLVIVVLEYFNRRIKFNPSVQSSSVYLKIGHDWNLRISDHLPSVDVYEKINFQVVFLDDDRDGGILSIRAHATEGDVNSDLKVEAQYLEQWQGNSFARYDLEIKEEEFYKIICAILLAERSRKAGEEFTAKLTEDIRRIAHQKSIGRMPCQEETWDRLEKAHADDHRVEGVIFRRVEDGFDVDMGGVIAFLPSSEIDDGSVHDVGKLFARKRNFKIREIGRRGGNIIVSRLAMLENLSEGQTVEGVVKKITDYGAFVDLGGFDGMLHVNDMAWHRVNPSEILTIGETIKVQVIKIKKEAFRIDLGMKQLQEDPWDLVAAKYPLGSVHQGRVTNITGYGAFVEMEAGVEGLVRVSEMSQIKENVHPGKIVSTSQQVEVVVLEIDNANRRMSLGLKCSRPTVR